MSSTQTTDVAVIGAGPAGSMAAARLSRLGWRVTVVERSHFPRFSIGESLLPQCMEWLEDAGMMGAMQLAGFQIKYGASFSHGHRYGELDYRQQFSSGWTWTWQVQRADFDQHLAQQAARQGARLRFGHALLAADFSSPGQPVLDIEDDQGGRYKLQARFVCDASGFARVLARLLDLDQPSDQPPRAAVFTHVEDRITASDYKREHIMISYHPRHPDVWYWLIPFGNQRASLGVTGNPDIVAPTGVDQQTRLKQLVAEEPWLSRWLKQAVYDDEVRSATQYAAAVSRQYGRDFALLGNAGEFIDPVFSSGVTLAMKSAVLASGLIDRQLQGQPADWESGFAEPLRHGASVFRAFVNSWYSGELKHVFFSQTPDADIKRMLSSILAGYVWDLNNPYASKTRRRLRALCQACAV